MEDTKFKIYWMRPFRKFTEYGHATDAIVTWYKIPSQFAQDCDEKGCTVRTVVWRCKLYIRLWFVDLDFAWYKDISKKDDSTLRPPKENN